MKNTVVETTRIIKPGLIQTTSSCAHITIRDIERGLVCINTGEIMCESQYFRAKDLREVAGVFLEMADVLESSGKG